MKRFSQFVNGGISDKNYFDENFFVVLFMGHFICYYKIYEINNKFHIKIIENSCKINIYSIC